MDDELILYNQSDMRSYPLMFQLAYLERLDMVK